LNSADPVARRPLAIFELIAKEGLQDLAVGGIAHPDFVSSIGLEVGTGLLFDHPNNTPSSVRTCRVCTHRHASPRRRSQPALAGLSFIFLRFFLSRFAATFAFSFLPLSPGNYNDSDFG
jgi:hypothetical protein